MNFYPFLWTKEFMWLKCSSCGEHIYLSHNYDQVVDFDTAERIAAINYYKDRHKCPPHVARLNEAKRIMKLYREKHPGITFEESVEVYNLILSQL